MRLISSRQLQLGKPDLLVEWLTSYTFLRNLTIRGEGLHQPSALLYRHVWTFPKFPSSYGRRITECVGRFTNPVHQDIAMPMILVGENLVLLGKLDSWNNESQAG